MYSNANNNNNIISIPVSDSDSDSPERTRVPRFRRKRRKPHRVSNDSPQRVIIKFLCKYWHFLVLLAAVLLLLFEATRIGSQPNSDPIPKVIHPNPKGHKPPDGNLNRLDPVTRVIDGVRQPCLKLLPPEEIQHLGFPTGDQLHSPVKNVVYLSDTTAADTNSALTSVGGRFNLFTGYQTFDQRVKSFKVNETVEMHCGFYSENGGFRISDEDKSYMNKCKVVVSTCAFGGGDDLYQPIGMSEASLQKVCYVAFWDEITLAAQELEGHKIGEDRFIGKWRIVLVRDLSFTDQRLNGKIPKMLGHRLFPNARYSIWVDSKSQFRRDPLAVLEALLWRSNSILAISEHGARSSVYDEAMAVVKKNKATPEEVALQLNQYRQDGLPDDKRFNGKKALNEASIIVREHTALTNMFMCIWFNEVVRFTSRDQLSFPYVLWRLKVLKDINAFPVCIRKDLVNSMGHRRKAKPLISQT